MELNPLLIAFGLAFCSAALLQLLHWQKVLRARKKNRKNYSTAVIIVVDFLIVIFSSLLGVLGVLVFDPPPGYVLAALIGMAPFPTVRFLAKLSLPAVKVTRSSQSDSSGLGGLGTSGRGGRGMGSGSGRSIKRGGGDSGSGGAGPLGGDFDFGQTDDPSPPAAPPPAAREATLLEFLHPEA